MFLNKYLKILPDVWFSENKILQIKWNLFIIKNENTD